MGLQRWCTLRARIASEAPAFRAVFRFRQAVVSAKIVGLKTTDPSKPAPEHKFRSLLCAFIGGTRIIYPKQTVSGWIRHLITQGLLGGSG